MGDERELHKIEKEWVSSGLNCKVIFLLNSHRCGYVAVPKSHPAYGILYEDVPAKIHGGLTFGSDRLAVKKYDNSYWFGFDCAHAGDKTLGSINTEDKHFWTKNEVVEETEKLAKQLSELTWNDIIKHKLEYMPDWFKERVEIKKASKKEEKIND